MFPSRTRDLDARPVRPAEKGLRLAVFLTVVLALGALFASALPRFELLSNRRAATFGLVLLLAFTGFVTKLLKQVLLAGWVISMTMFRPYSTFDGLFGLEGLYWVPAHLALIALYGIWIYELAILGRPLVRYGRAFWPWFLPFLAAAAISALQAERMNWAAAELLRIGWVIPIYIYCRYNLGWREWRVCLAALAIALLAQVAIGVVQVTTHRFLPAEWEGSARAEGMMVHPNILADYLLLLFPAALALALAGRDMRLRLVAAGVAAAGALGIAITLSRIPWVLMVLQFLLVGVSLTVLSMLSIKRLIGLCSVGALAALIAVAPFLDKLAQRVTGDLQESIQFRGELNRAAGLVFEEAPFGGVGLNNLSLHIFDVARKYGYTDLILNERDWGTEGGTVIRRISVHNLYLFLLAETGLFGAVGLALYFLAAIGRGLRAGAASTGELRALSLGFIVGMVGVLAHNVAEVALWMDPLLHSFALVVAMLSAVPVLAQTGGGEIVPLQKWSAPWD